MELTYRHDGQGGFMVRMARTNITCYAYPSSDHAVKARKNPAKVAACMMAAEIEFLPTAVEVMGYRRAILHDETLTYSNRYLIRERAEVA